VHDLVSRLKTALKQPLPGIEAQYLMAPVNRGRVKVETLDPSQVTEGAVLILLFVNEEEIFFPLIERTAYDGVHSAQISLPGGKRDLSDATLEDTALRECFEEVGIDKDIEILGRLTNLYIPVSKFLVQPVVAACYLKDPVFVPHTREVQKVIRMPLSQLINGNCEAIGTVTYGNGLSLKCPYYLVQEKQVWGATAMILSELREVLKSDALIIRDHGAE
jgi:8-oxo-dGTP pyrophosphatase MutT (NUDIX family)